VPAPSVDPLKKPPTNSIPAYPDGPLPVPKIGSERDAGVNPVGGYEVTPQDDALPKVERNDLSTDRGGPWRPPVANIPVPRTAQPIPPAAAPGRGESRKEVAGGYGFVGTDGRQADLPGAKLVLVNFFSTGSMAGAQAVPALNGLREKYAARGVEVAGMNCDDDTLDARVAAGERFAKEQGAGYPILTESGKRPGALLKRYGIAELPTAVLLNESGDVLWQGSPNKPTGLAEAIEKGR
jgi:cytochrome c biogenesis protein CcmG, thiol:disulfide interchange protein DsbE